MIMQEKAYFLAQEIRTTVEEEFFNRVANSVQYIETERRRYINLHPQRTGGRRKQNAGSFAYLREGFFVELCSDLKDIALQIKAYAEGAISKDQIQDYLVTHCFTGGVEAVGRNRAEPVGNLWEKAKVLEMALREKDDFITQVNGRVKELKSKSNGNGKSGFAFRALATVEELGQFLQTLDALKTELNIVPPLTPQQSKAKPGPLRR